MADLGAVHDTTLVALVQHLLGVERGIWILTFSLVAVGLTLVIGLTVIGDTRIVPWALSATVGAFSSGMWAHRSVGRQLLQVIDRMSEEEAVRLAAVTAHQEHELPSPRLPLSSQ